MTRRGFLASSAVAGTAVAGGWLATRRYLEEARKSQKILPGQPLALTSDDKLLDTDFSDPGGGGEFLGYLPFEFESVQNQDAFKLGVPFGRGHNARRLIDPASLLMPESRLTPADKFYIRTAYPDQIQPPPEWTIKIHGEVKQSQDVPLKQLLPAIENKKPALLECSGNERELRFGLMSVAEWSGIPIQEIVKRAQPTSKAKAILINGFDDDSLLADERPPYQTHSWPTCSWVFPIDELVNAGALLATELNGAPLPKEQGAPVRLVVPGWYGCAQSKWVNEIKFVDENEPATLQMLEFAFRTMQPLTVDEVNPNPPGVGPEKARDYRPATIDQVTLPVRVEAWRRDGKFVYRIVGITWGGSQRTDKLLIRFLHGNRPRFEPVQFCQIKTSNPEYGIWCHHWQPTRPGIHWIEMRLGDPTVRARKLMQTTPLGSKLKVSNYARAVFVPEV
jgi:DMSO/TMAO reductase YedYZ molybdopterin-dependent catalytic subunit